ncbi:S66 family peptidase [Enterococcus sp. LJL128]
MNKPKRLKKGDKIAIVSLSSGLLGEEGTSHNVSIGKERLESLGLIPVFMPNALKGIDYLKNHPEARAEDLKAAFLDPAIKGIICAIGGDDTYRLLPFLMEDEAFIQTVKDQPKIFTGFSDTTINHLMFYQLGLTTYYGPAFITDLADIAVDMLPYTKKYFLNFLDSQSEIQEISSSDIWYEERTDFSREAIGQDRVAHTETKGFELLQGSSVFEGPLLGGCIESLSDILTANRYPDEQKICEHYRLFPALEKWRGSILFIETSEEQPTPKVFREILQLLKEKRIFEVVNGIIVGKPQDEKYYEEYKEELLQVIDNKNLPILYNINFGHATPRCVLPYGVVCEVNADESILRFKESMFSG